ncbi:MAG: dihydrodipicolinate synthase family protein [Gordonia sp. (in: high G+C Gram-positive bacteria)]
MNRFDVDWSGYWPAAPTPYSADGSVDETSLGELMELYVSNGVHGVLINGSTGEWFSQSRSERERVARCAVEALAGRVPVIVGVSSYTADESVHVARSAAAAGADGILATIPPYVHPAPDEVIEFYRCVSQATDLPFMVYNWPRGVVVDLAKIDGLMHRLALLPQIAAIKDSTGDWEAMVQTTQSVSGEVRVFGSFSSRRGLAILAGLGGDGAIDGGGVGAPYGVPYYEAALKGDIDLARFWVDKYQLLSASLIYPDYSGRYASPVVQLKAAMHLLDQPAGRVRKPLLELTDTHALRTIAEILRTAELPVSHDREREVCEIRSTW